MCGPFSPDRLACGLLLVLFVIAGGTLRAQSRNPGVVDPQASDVVSLLKSSDARQQAWGAWLSVRDHRPDLVPLLAAVVSRRQSGVSVADRAATDTALDALIQFRATVPSDVAVLLLPQRPAQALALLSMPGDADDALLMIVRSERDTPWFAAANIALTRKTNGLAAAMLEGPNISVDLVISESGSTRFGGGAGMAIGCGVNSLAEGLPPWPTYELTRFARSGVVVVANGPTPVYYERTVVPAGVSPAGHSIGMDGPSTRDRLAYLAAVARVRLDSMPLNGYDQYPVRRQDVVSRDAEVARVRADVLRRYRDLLERLIRAGALTSDEAAALPPPAVNVVVHELD